MLMQLACCCCCCCCPWCRSWTRGYARTLASSTCFSSTLGGVVYIAGCVTSGENVLSVLPGMVALAKAGRRIAKPANSLCSFVFRLLCLGRDSCRARKLTDEQRAAIANYFAVYKGQERGVAKLALALDDHPAIARAYALLQKAFEQVGQLSGGWVGRGLVATVKRPGVAVGGVAVFYAGLASPCMLDSASTPCGVPSSVASLHNPRLPLPRVSAHPTRAAAAGG